MTEHLPVLQVVVPLLAAPLCLVFRRATFAHFFAVAVAWTCFAIAITLLWRVIGEGSISYELGGWPPPIGIEYRVDVINAFVLAIVSGRDLHSTGDRPRSAGHAIPTGREHLFYATFLLCLAGCSA